MMPVAYIAFWPKEPGQWWARNYGHISTFWNEKDTWIHLNAEGRGFEVGVFHAHDEVEDFLTYMFAHTLVVRHEVLLRSHFFQPMTCVSVTKHAFGIKSRALFPDGLLRTLRKSPHAEILNEGQESQRDARAESRARPRPG